MDVFVNIACQSWNDTYWTYPQSWPSPAHLTASLLSHDRYQGYHMATAIRCFLQGIFFKNVAQATSGSGITHSLCTHFHMHELADTHD